jgi:hypothetical protein
MCAEYSEDRRRSERICLDAGLEVYVDTEINGARPMDLSQTGLRFETSEPMTMILHLSVNGEREEREARLVWAQIQDDGSVQYGLEFVAEGGEYLDPETGEEE